MAAPYAGLNCDGFCLAARGELQHVETDLIAGSALQLSLIEKVSVRRAWGVALSIRVREQSVALASEAAPDTAGISSIDANNLHVMFDRCHGFRVPSRRLLDDALLGRLLREFTAVPKRLRFIPPEHLRLAGTIAIPVGSTLSLFNGNLSSHDVLAPEDYRDNVELFKRIRALLNSLSLVTISDPTWLPFMTGDHFADQILDWMNATYNGQRYPLKFYSQAYACTMNYFIDEIRTNNTSMATLINNQAQYRSFWTTYVPPATQGPPTMRPPPHANNGSRSGNPGQPDLPAALAREVANLRNTSSRINMRMDRVEGRQNQGGGGNQDGGHYGKGGLPREDFRPPVDRRPAGTTSIKGKGKRNDGRNNPSGSSRKVGRRR